MNPTIHKWLICDVVIMFVDYLKPRRNIVMMFVDYLKPRRNIVFVDYLKHCLLFYSLRCDTAPWLARRPACPWRRAGGAKHKNDHYDYDYQHTNDHDKFDHQHYIITMILVIVITMTTIILMIRRSTVKTLQCLFSTLLSPNDHFQTTFAAGHPWLPLNW